MAITVCQCPVSTTIASVVTSLSACKLEIGQIQKAIFWRHGQLLTAAASAIASSVWTVHLTALNDTKAVVSPMLSLIIPPTEVREVGSGNEVTNGIPIVLGTLPVKVEGHIWETAQTAIANLKKLGCENLDVMFINENNQLIYSLEAGKVKGFPIGTSLFVSDIGTGSFTDGTKNMFHFSLNGGWSDTLTVTAATTFLLDMVNS
jgi:hypothetical protein